MTNTEPDRANRREWLENEAARLRARLPDYSMSFLYVLMAVNAVEAADRTILATVFDDVKHAFHVGDSQLGVLVAAYSVVATLAAVPFGFLADRRNRVRLVALGLVPWGLAMWWSAAATSFAMMFIARLLLGTVEATAGPSTPSLIGDYWQVDRRNRIFGVFGIGTLVGTLLGFGVAGLLATIFSWRFTFVAWGAIGLLMATVVLRVLKEPERGVPDALFRIESDLAALDNPKPAAESDDELVAAVARVGTWDYQSMSIRETIREVMRIRTMWVLFVAGSLIEFLISGLGTWAVSFFRRYHHLSTAAAGGVTALLAVGTVVGVLMGGRWGDRLVSDGKPARRIHLCAVASILTLFTIVPAFASGNLPIAVPFFLATGFLIGVPMAPLQAVGLDIIVPQLRGRASSIRSVLRVGMTAAAPLVFGVLSDAFNLRNAILLSSPVLVFGGLIMFYAAGTYTADAEFAQAEALRQHSLQEAAAV